MNRPSTGSSGSTSTTLMSKKTRKRKWRVRKGKANHGKRPA
ncbi:hypothetical protein AB0Q95_02440 [Streptomyces sp. NPDC059900]